MKIHDEVKMRGDREVMVWGSGTPRREFLYSDDLADACVFLMNLPEGTFSSLLGRAASLPPLVNIGVGEDLTIRNLAETIQQIMGYPGRIVFDPGKPDGTPRKLLDVGRLRRMGWRPGTLLNAGLAMAYQDFRRAVSVQYTSNR
jgi:GDP-L-fucose synthase